MASFLPFHLCLCSFFLFLSFFLSFFFGDLIFLWWWIVDGGLWMANGELP